MKRTLPVLYNFDIYVSVSCNIQMVEADIPQSLFEEQGRQLYGAKLLQIQVGTCINTYYFRVPNLVP